MAAIDYGALIIKNGIPINKNQDLFMTPPDYVDDEVRGNYYVYCGDAECTLAFYKTYIGVVKGGHCIKTLWDFECSEETFHLDDFTLTVRRLDDLYPEKRTNLCDHTVWADYVRENWSGATGNEKPWELQDGMKYWKQWCKNCKHIARQPIVWYRSTLKYSATWEYKGDKWEVIFGYGIDPHEDIFNDVVAAGTYSYGEKSAKYIKEKFFI